MKIKVFVIMALLSTAAISGAYGFGLGAQLNYSAGSIFAPGAALLFSPSDRTNLAVNWFINKDADSIVGLTFDAVPLSFPIALIFRFNLGVGLYVNAILRNEILFNGGVRVPVGFSLLLGRDMFEIFTHVAPSFGVDFVPSLGIGEPFYPIALGARVWFR